jgi:hypothetical protein
MNSRLSTTEPARRMTAIARILALFALAALSACNGGSDSSPPATSVSTNAVAFDVTSPDAATPASQTVTATVSEGTLYLTVLHSGTAIASATYTLNGTTAEIVINPAAPEVLGAGVFMGAVSVTGYQCADASCSRIVSGNAQTVTVTYNIPPIIRYVAPYVSPAGTAETVIVRGRGFTKFAVNDVTFGGTSSTSFTVVSDTQISATHPALSAGTYAVQIIAPTSPGTITSSGNLVVANAPGYGAQTISYPATVTDIRQMLYDAQRGELVLAVTDTSGGDLIRYRFSGSSWVTQPITDLTDVALATDGAYLFALSSTGGLTEVTPSTLALGTNTPVPSFPTSGTWFRGIAPGNDGIVLLTTGHATSGTYTPVYTYNRRTTGFTQSSVTLDNGTPGSSADGALAVFSGGDSGLTTGPYVHEFFGASNLFASTSVALNQRDPTVFPAIAPALDRAATRIVLNDSSDNFRVVNGSFAFLGLLPTTTRGVVLSPDAHYAYTYDSGSGLLRVFDLTGTVDSNSFFPEVGSGTALAGSPGTGAAKMAISPDGGILFLAGNSRIVVQPKP